jgi:uncharacterized protein
MLLNILKAKANEGVEQSFDLTSPLNQDVLMDRNCKPLSDVHIVGTMKYLNDHLYLDGQAKVKLSCLCDNCGTEFERNFVFDIKETFVESYDSHNSEDYIILQGCVNLDEPLLDNLLLQLSSRLLCKKDCKGLCYICGKNKNLYSCNCEEIEKELERQEENPFSKIKNRR